MRLALLLALAAALPALASDNCLYDAIEWQGIEHVRACLEKGADPNAPTQYGTTGQLNALMLALSRRKMDVAKVLGEHGAKIDQTSDGGKEFWTNLGGSTIRQDGKPVALYNLEAIDFCLRMGADINRVARAGETIAMAATRSGNLELLSALVERGAKLDARSEHGETVLHIAAWRGDMPTIAFLIEMGADPMARDRSGRTPAQHAASNGKEEAFELFRKHGATLTPEEIGRMAAEEKAAAIAKKLVQGGAKMGADELKRLARSGGWDMLETALVGGAAVDVELAKQPIWWMGDVRQRAREGERAAQLVDVARYETVLARLVKSVKPAKAELEELLFLAIEKTDPAGVRVLVAAGADPNAKTSFDMTALGRAASTGDVETINELVKLKANLEGTGRDGRTPLFQAMLQGHVEAVKALLEAGADPKRKDAMGLTTGQLARQSGRTEVALALAERTGDGEAQSAARVRALVEAAMGQQPTRLAEAMKAQPDLDAADDEKRVALVQAAMYGRVENAQALLDAGANPDRTEGECAGPLPPLAPTGGGLLKKRGAAPPRDEAPAEPPPEPPVPEPPVGGLLAPPPAHVDAPVALDGRPAPPGCVPMPGPRQRALRPSQPVSDLAGNSGQTLAVHGPRYDSCRTALIAAIDRDSAELVKLLLAKKARVDLEVGAAKRTALDAAARVGNPTVVRLLLEAGASVVHRDGYGRMALDLAREVGNTKAAKLIGARR